MDIKMVNWHTGDIGKDWSVAHRRLEKDEQRERMVGLSLDALGLDAEMFGQFRELQYFWDIIAEAYLDPEKPKTFFAAEIMFFENRKIENEKAAKERLIYERSRPHRWIEIS